MDRALCQEGWKLMMELPQITIGELTELVERQANVVVATGTGKGLFDEHDDDYQERDRTIIREFKRLGYHVLKSTGGEIILIIPTIYGNGTASVRHIDTGYGSFAPAKCVDYFHCYLIELRLINCGCCA